MYICDLFGSMNKNEHLVYTPNVGVTTPRGMNKN